jgi:hypothetical protein
MLRANMYQSNRTSLRFPKVINSKVETKDVQATTVRVNLWSTDVDRSQGRSKMGFLPKLIVFVIRIGYLLQESQLLVQVRIERLKNDYSEMPDLNITVSDVTHNSDLYTRKRTWGSIQQSVKRETYFYKRRQHRTCCEYN